MEKQTDKMLTHFMLWKYVKTMESHIETLNNKTLFAEKIVLRI